MEKNPLVSICMPTYNGASYLAEALDSAVSQDYENLEILIVDDGSTDNTINIIEEYQQKYNKIRLVKNPQSSGMVGNWNACLKEAKGEWIQYLFQDDKLASNSVSTMLQACVKHNAEVAVCRRDFVIEENASEYNKKLFAEKVIKLERVIKEPGFIPAKEVAEYVKKFLIYNFMGEPPCYFFKRELLKEAGYFNTHMKQLVDYEFIVRLALLKGFVFVPDPLLFFRVHNTSATSKNTTSEQGLDDSYKNIQAVRGDSIILLYNYLYNDSFSLVKEATGETVLKNYLRSLFYSGCKKFGARKFKMALASTIEAHPLLGKLRYNLIANIVYRKKTKWWLKRNRYFPYENYRKKTP